MGETPIAAPERHGLLPWVEDLSSQQQGRRECTHQQLALDHAQSPPGDNRREGELAHQGAEGLHLAIEIVGYHPLPGQLLLAVLVSDEKLTTETVGLDQTDRLDQFALVGDPIQLQLIAALGVIFKGASECQSP